MAMDPKKSIEAAATVAEKEWQAAAKEETAKSLLYGNRKNIKLTSRQY